MVNIVTNFLEGHKVVFSMKFTKIVTNGESFKQRLHFFTLKKAQQSLPNLFDYNYLFLKKYRIKIILVFLTDRSCK